MNPIHELKRRLDEQGLWQHRRTLTRNEYLLNKGQSSSDLYFVVEGSLRLFIVEDQKEHTIRFGYAGSFFAALDSFITGSPSELYVQAIKQTQLLSISKASFMDFVESDKSNLKLWHSILEQLVFQQFEREIDILTSSPVERYNRVLRRSPQLFQEIPHKYIASYLRMTPETLSRLKKS